MSIALMTEVWRLDLSPSDKMVLLALADAANDEGVTWIAVRHRNEDDVRLDLLTKCSLSERAVQGALKRLSEAGLLARKDVPGRGVIWTVLPAKNERSTPAANAPRSKCAPAANDVYPRSKCGETVNNPQPTSEDKSSSVDAPAKVSAFDQFWTAYPSKVGKGAARRAFEKAERLIRRSGGDPLAVMLASLHRHIRSSRWNDPTYTIPNPATWLTQERWGDDPDAAGSGKPRPASAPPAAPSAMSAELQAKRRAMLEAEDA